MPNYERAPSVDLDYMIMLRSHSDKLLLLASKFPLARRFTQTTNGSV